jgi:hypothetical protein
LLSDSFSFIVPQLLPAKFSASRATLRHMIALAILTFGLSAQPTAEVSGIRSLAVMPAVAVGANAPDLVVLQKLTELIERSVRQQGIATERPAEPDPFAALVERARQRYFELDFPAAAAMATQAIELYRSQPTALGSGEGLVTAHLVAALASIELGADDIATSHFVAVQTLRPEQALSRSEYSPGVVAAFEKVRESRGVTAGNGPLSISSSPAFATVRLDGRPVGATPLTLAAVPPGEHFIEVARDRYVTQVFWQTVTKDGAEVALTLKESPEALLRQQVARGVSEASPDVVVAAGELAAVLGVDAVLLLAVGEPDRPGIPAQSTEAAAQYLVSAARISRDAGTARAYVGIDRDLLSAPRQVTALVAHLLSAESDTAPAAIGLPAPRRPDYAHAFLGLAPPPLEITTSLQPEPLWLQGWVWTIAGAVIVCAATAGTIIYLKTRSAPSPGVRVTVQLPQSP